MQHNWTNVPSLCNLKYFSCPHYEFVIHNVLLLCAIMYHTHNEFVVVSTLVFAPWVSCNNFAPGAVWHRTSHHNGKSSMDCCMVLFQSLTTMALIQKKCSKAASKWSNFCVWHMLTNLECYCSLATILPPPQPPNLLQAEICFCDIHGLPQLSHLDCWPSPVLSKTILDLNTVVFNNIVPDVPHDIAPKHCRSNITQHSAIKWLQNIK